MDWFDVGVQALRRLSQELDQIETGERDSLSEQHPRELLRLTGSLNRLLQSEREQRARYRDSLDDLAHSLKTPLAVLQGVSESMAQRPQDREQAWVLQTQIERMNQQISYQLQRASLRKSGLVRHQVELIPVVESLCNTLEKVYRDKRVNVSYDIPALSHVPIEQNALLELLGNLLENAWRLCLSQVRISLHRTQAGIDVCVEDDGPGVPPDQRARILQRGERLDRQHPGQGGMACGHAQHIVVEGASMGQRIAAARIAPVHHVRASAEHAERQPAAQVFARSGQVRRDVQ